MLYSLILTDPELSYENHSEDFFIGIFATRQKAEETACYYLGNLPGFCDYSCTYRIEEKEVVDNSDNAMPVSVWIVQGWNVNDNFDEIDILESECFLTEERAKAEMKMMKETSPRSEWNIDRLTVGECHWREGFVILSIMVDRKNSKSRKVKQRLEGWNNRACV